MIKMSGRGSSMAMDDDDRCVFCCWLLREKCRGEEGTETVLEATACSSIWSSLSITDVRIAREINALLVLIPLCEINVSICGRKPCGHPSKKWVPT
jgi:hypothetical protein